MSTQLYQHLELGSNDPKASQPLCVKVRLMPHQLTAIAKMIVMERTNSYRLLDRKVTIEEATKGFLADPPGTGKTLTMLGLIASNSPDNIRQAQSKAILRDDQNQACLIRRDHHYTQEALFLNTLIIVSHGPVFQQWSTAIQQQTFLTFLPIENSSQFNSLPSNPSEAFSHFKSFGIVLVSGTYFERLYHRYGPVFNAWNRAVIDDATSICLSGRMSMINSKFTWFISDIPSRLPWSTTSGYIRDSFRPGQKNCIDYLTVKNDPAYIKSTISPQPRRDLKYLCRDSYNLNKLSQIANHQIINLLNADDIDSALKCLKGNEGDDLISLVTKDIQRSIDKKIFEIQVMRHQISGDDARRSTHLSILDQELKNLNHKYNQTIDRIKNLDEKDCIICYETLQDPVALSCSHVFCGKCIMRWVKEQVNPYRSVSTCPVCKCDIDIKTSIRVHETNEHLRPTMLKADKVIRLIMAKPLGKFIIFSDHVASFNQLENALISAGIESQQLKGPPAVQAKVLNDFKQFAHDGGFSRSKLRVVMLSSQYNGAGIDMHFATDVIMYQKAAPDVTLQIGARADRIGRTNALTVHHLFHSNELGRNDTDYEIAKC